MTPTNQIAEADAMPRTLADLVRMERLVASGQLVPMLTVQEAAILMRISPRDVRTQIEIGNLKAKRISQRNVLIHPDNLRAWQTGKVAR